MEELEKIDKLKERANVTYEEAREALNACGGDLLDAIVYLEKQGKTKTPEYTSYSTTYEEQTQLTSVKEKVKSGEKSGERVWDKIRRIFKKLVQKSKDNYFCVERRGESVVKMPVWGLVLALLLAWELVCVILVVALFFECHYSFCGKDDLKKVNDVMDKASQFADQVKDEFEKL